MSRINFGSLESEPSGLTDLYEILGDARSNVDSSAYVLPSGLQTPTYAKIVLEKANAPDLAAARMNMRMHREQTLAEAKIPSTIYLGAAALSHLYFADKDIMLGQLERVKTAVEDDIEAGPTSLLRIGIIPVSKIKPLPDGLPEGLSLVTPQDVRVVETDSDTFTVGSDGFEVDRIGESGLRGAEALRRQAMLGSWASMAVFGEGALALIEESRAVLMAKA
jgi:hypothetical protein